MSDNISPLLLLLLLFEEEEEDVPCQFVNARESAEVRSRACVRLV